MLVYWPTLCETVLWFTVNPVVEATYQGEYRTRALLLLRDSKGAPANWLRSKKSGIDQVGGDDESTTLPAPTSLRAPLVPL